MAILYTLIFGFIFHRRFGTFLGGCFPRFITTNFPQTSLSDFTFLASPISTTDFPRRCTLFTLHRLLRLVSGGTFFRHATTFGASQPSPRHNFLRDTTSLATQLSSLLNFRRPTTFYRNSTLLSPRIATHSSSLSTLSFADASYFRLNCAIFWLKTPRFSLKMSHFRRKWPISSEKDTGTVL